MRIFLHSPHWCTKWCQCGADVAQQTGRHVDEVGWISILLFKWADLRVHEAIGPLLKSFQRTPAAQIRTRIRQHFRSGLFLSVCVCMCARTLSSQPSIDTHSELWFANEKWIADTIHELCSCHGDINQKTDLFSRLANIVLAEVRCTAGAARWAAWASAGQSDSEIWVVPVSYRFIMSATQQSHACRRTHRRHK